MAGSVEIASLYAKISADSSEFTRAMKGADSALGKTGAALGTFVKVGIGAAVAGFGAIVAGIGSSLKTVAAFDKQMSAAGAILNATGEEMKQLNALAMDLGKTTQFSASDAAAAIENLGAQGVSVKDILGGAAKGVVDLAAATGTDLPNAADIGATAMTLFGIEAKDMTKAVNSISGVTNASRFDIDDYALALANGGASLSKLGVSFDDFNAVTAATASSFTSGQTSGTAFRTFVTRMIPTGADAAEAMRKLGLWTGMTGDEYEKAQADIAKYEEQLGDLDPTSKNYEQRAEELRNKIIGLRKSLVAGKNAFFDAEGNMKSFDQVAAILKKNLTGLSEETKNALLGKAFGADASPMVLALASIGEEGINAAKGTIATTDAAEQARRRMDNLAGDVEQATGSFETLKLKIADVFKPFARKGVQGITAFLNRLLEMDFTPLERGVQRLFDFVSNAFSGGGDLLSRILGLGNLDAADRLLEISDIFAGWARGIWKIVREPLLKFWNQLEQWITDPVRRSKILGALNRTWRGFMQWAKGLWDQVGPALDGFWRTLTTWTGDQTKGNRLAVYAKMMMAGLWGWAKGIWEIVEPDLTKLWNGIKDWATDSTRLSELATAAGTLFGGLWEWAKWLWGGSNGEGGIKSLLGAMWGSLTSWVTDGAKRSQLFTAISGAWTSFVDWAGAIWSGSEGQQGLGSKLGDMWTSLTSWVTDPEKRGQLWSAITGAWTSFWEWAGAIWNGTPEAPGGLKGALGSMWGWLTAWVTDPEKRGQLWSAITGAWTSFWDWASSIWKGTPEAPGGLSAALGSLWSGITSWVTDPEKRGQLWSAITGAWTSFWEWADSIWSGTPEAPGGLRGKLAKVWDSLTGWITDPQKRSDLFAAIGGAWKGFTDWAGSLWNGTPQNPGGIGGQLGTMWSWLIGWVTNPEKRSKLWTSITGAWTSFADWAGAVWSGTPENPGGISAKLGTMFGNLNTWLDENVPALKPWKDAFVTFATDAATQWDISFPNMASTVTDLKDSLLRDVPLIGQEFADLWTTIFGDDSTGGGSIKWVETFVAVFSHGMKQTFRELALLMGILADAGALWKAFFAGNWDEVIKRGQEGSAKWGDLWETISTPMTLPGANTNTGTPPLVPGQYEGQTMQLNGHTWVWQNHGWSVVPGMASGGRVDRTGMTLVGEEGPELVNLSAGQHVYDAAQTAAMIGGGSGVLTIDLNVHGDSDLPTDRIKLKELARALMGELELRGLRVTA